MQVSDNKIVSLRYVMKDQRGEELENTLDGIPVKYLHGSGGIMQELQSGLAGMKASEKRSISINIDTGNNSQDKFYFDVVIDQIRDATKEEISKGHPIETVDETDCGPNCIC